MAVQLHAHQLVSDAADQFRREIASKPDPAQHQKALDDALRASRLQPGSGALFLAAGLESRGGRRPEAERLALRATRREPQNFATWLTLGVMRRGSGDERGARAAFAKAQQLNPLYQTPR
jgi:Flp pilus assembly protein TadD